VLEDLLHKSYCVEQECLGGYLISQEYNVNREIYRYVADWIEAETRDDCMAVLSSVNEEIGVSTGDFVKTILKTVKLAKEIQTAAVVSGEVELEHKCSVVPELLLKHIVTNQSLYV
jgi:superfamily II RNA helicase